MASAKGFAEIDAKAERVGVIGSPSKTISVKVDIVAEASEKRLVGALTYFSFRQESQRQVALGQITEIMLKNHWVEEGTMRSLIRQKGRVDPITERQDVHVADMTVGAVFAENGGAFEQSQLGTIPSTGTDVKLVDNALLDVLLANQGDQLFKIGRIFGTQTYFPAWFRHFSHGPGGAGEAYHVGVFGKTGSGKSVLAKVMLTGYLHHPQMSVIVIDPQGEFYKDFSGTSPVHQYVAKELGRPVTAVNVKDLWLTDSDRTYGFFLEILAKTTFFRNLIIISPENQERAMTEIARILRAKPAGLDKFASKSEPPKPWELHRREVFNKVWAALGEEETQGRIYTSENLARRTGQAHAQADPDEMYAIWAGTARLFSNQGRERAHKLKDLVANLQDATRGHLVVVDISEEQAPRDIQWNDEIKLVIIRKLIEELQRAGEESYRANKRLNALVLLDEAHRYAPRDVSQKDNEELHRMKTVLVDAVRTTRKYGLGWAFISQTLHSLDRELLMQLRVYLFGYGLGWGAEYRALDELIGGNEAIALYRSFRDPETSLGEKQYPFMAVGPVSPLSFSGAPLLFNALRWPDEVLALFRERKTR